MALQPNQRAKMKGQMTTAKRQQPTMVTRSNKTILVELAPIHEKMGPRFYLRWAWC